MIKFKKGLNKTKIFLSFSTHMVTDTYASFIVGFIPILAVKLELSLFLVSILSSVNFISNSITQPVFGYLSDKYGIRYFLIAGPLVASIFISILGVSPNYWSILIFLFLGNLGVAAIHPPTAATASHIGGSRKGFLNSIIAFGGTIGFSAGSLFVILIINKLGLKFTPLAAIPGIIMTLVLLKFPASVFQPGTKNAGVGFIKKLRSLKKTKLVLLFLIAFASYSRDLTVLSMFTFMPLYFTGQGVELINFGYIILAFILIGGIGGLFAGYYSDKIRKRTVVIQAGLIISIPLFYLIFKVPLSISIVLFILAGFFATSTLPLCIRVVQDIFPGNVSLASSIVMGVSGGIAAATVILVGKIADNIGMVRTINYVLIIPILASMLLFLFPHVRSKYR
ncbi:MAG: MFS transporter [Actinobacteria bacterium]|nr:MFS transporter [Actinomycetota bacterium]